MREKLENTVDYKELDQKYRKAKEKVSAMQGFYYHLAVYLIINAVLLILRPAVRTWGEARLEEATPDFINWVDLNILITPILWGIVLVVHYFVVFGLRIPFLRNWEKRKIAELMEKDQRSL